MESLLKESLRISSFSGEEVSAETKSIPYISMKASNIVNFNCKIKVEDECISCSHLSTLYVLNSSYAHKAGEKLDVSKMFESENAVREALTRKPRYIEEDYSRMIKNAKAKHIIACDDFGRFLYNIAITTSSSQCRIFFLQSTSHIMAFEFLRKPTVKNRSADKLVVKFFDPNRTNVTSRSRVYSSDDFLNSNAFCLRKFIKSSMYSLYFGENLEGKCVEETECIIYEHHHENVECLRFSTLETLSQEGISSCMMYHLIIDANCLEDVRKAVEMLSTLDLSKKGREDIFRCRSSNGNSVLVEIMSLGKVQSIDLYSLLLNSMSDEEKVSLLPSILLSSNIHGSTGLYLALQNGYSDAVYAFDKMLNNLILIESKIDCSEFAMILSNLFAAKSSEGIPGLFMALQGDMHKTVTAFGELLNRLVCMRNKLSDTKIVDMIFDLLSAKTKDGIPGLFMALQKDNHSSVSSFGKLINILTLFRGSIFGEKLFRMFVELMLAKNISGTTGMYMSLQNNCHNSIYAFDEILCNFLPITKDDVPVHVFLQALRTMLLAKSDCDVCGLFMALQLGNHSSIAAFSKLLSKLLLVKDKISESDLAGAFSEILLAKNKHGTPGLFMALQCGHADAIAAFGSLVDVLVEAKENFSPDTFAAIALDIFTSKRYTDGTPGLFAALAGCKPKATSEFGRLLMKVRECNNWSVLLAAEDGNGVPGLLYTDESTRESYFKMLTEFPTNTLQDLHSRLCRARSVNSYQSFVCVNPYDGICYDEFIKRLAAHIEDTSKRQPTHHN
ncbi:ShET2/EspL2 family type III secretion system effector toxin [Candidatus Ichthyocystis sparus]|uniref:ShET2/EspL2 family type III secretion system effector toxin n=1 Tax=Candidatus Ichthyocystis sparus TaxID=1561004 RepID=UPI000B81501E|nr:ShET2/EspL2 family type III secretion system effector toxin [Candidatus Ichthyocystis sparus]